MDAVLRPIAASDQDFLWEMLYQAIYVPPGSPLPPREVVLQPELAHYVEDWPQPGDLGLIAEDLVDHRPIGAAWLRLFTSAAPGYGFIAEGIPELSIAIVPERRGHGLGTLLMESLLKIARRKYAAVSLSVSAENPAARLYERMGFEVRHQAGDSWMMMLQLTKDEFGTCNSQTPVDPPGRV